MATSNKAVKITYWIFTGLLGLILIPGIFFMNQPFALVGPRHLQIPEWLRYEVGIGQFIGGLLIVLPFISSRFKEWAYVGVGIVYISGFIGHVAIDGSGAAAAAMQAIIFLAILFASYIPYHKLKALKS
jgi:hypothetical protein